MQQRHMPQPISVVGVKGIYAIVLCDRIHHVVRALPRNRNFRKEQRLGVDNSIHGEVNSFPKLEEFTFLVVKIVSCRL